MIFNSNHTFKLTKRNTRSKKKTNAVLKSLHNAIVKILLCNSKIFVLSLQSTRNQYAKINVFE